ncbi:hypothetical protein D3C76_1097410 [compost metagenome]
MIDGRARNDNQAILRLITRNHGQFYAFGLCNFVTEQFDGFRLFFQSRQCGVCDGTQRGSPGNGLFCRLNASLYDSGNDILHRPRYTVFAVLDTCLNRNKASHIFHAIEKRPVPGGGMAITFGFAIGFQLREPYDVFDNHHVLKRNIITITYKRITQNQSIQSLGRAGVFQFIGRLCSFRRFGWNRISCRHQGSCTRKIIQLLPTLGKAQLS